MPEVEDKFGFDWTTYVATLDKAGYIYETQLPLWTCEKCGAVVPDNATDKHLDFHGRHGA